MRVLPCSPFLQAISPSTSRNTSMNSNTANVLSALGTLIGYLGTEATPGDFFDRLLWPQRFYNGFNGYNAWKLVLFMPMGGPLHKAALQTLDRFNENGLLEGKSLGRMLGTAFFHDSENEYTVYEEGAPPEQEYVRNGLWVRAINKMPVLLANAPKKWKHEDGVPLLKKVRQKTTVSCLTLSRVDSRTTGTTIDHDSTAPRLSTYAAIILTEATGIATAAVVMAIWRSWFMVLWLFPLILKLVSTAFTLDREPLLSPLERKGADMHKEKQNGGPSIAKYNIANSGKGFLVIEGESSLVLQFFRHYGHPIRSWARECLQIAIVVAFVLIFPIGLLCSIVWMPVGLQYLWLCYQLFTIIAMHVYRYGNGHHWATTEEMICQHFLEAETRQDDPQLIFSSGSKESSLCARLVRTAHDSYGDGRAHVLQLLSAGKYLPDESDDRNLTLRRPWSEASTETAASINTQEISVSSS